MLEPVIKTIEVPCSQKKAFEVFAHQFGSWWPLDKRSMSAMKGRRPVSLVLDPKVGGTVVEVGDDGQEHLWGTVRVFNPFSGIAMDFHMGLPPETASLLEIDFTELEAEKTRVTLTQSHWEAFGDMAEMMRDGYGSSWSMIFEEGYGAACGLS